jgi:DNA repair exonuclease SbcCD ATPase subunit
MIEIGNLEEAVFKIQRLLKWFEIEANIDKALSSDGGPIEQRKRAVDYIKQTAQLISFIKDSSMERYPEKVLELEENYKSSVESLEAFNKIISDNELNAARAFHLSQDALTRMLNNVSEFIGLVKSVDENPLITKVLELKQRVEYLEAERYQLLVELRRLKGGEEPILETPTFQTPHIITSDSLQQEIEKLRNEKGMLEQQLNDLRKGEKSIAYQSLLKENSELRERTARLTEALKITRARNENRFKQLLQERDEWRTKALEKTVHTIEETMYNLRNQLENLKKENQQLKQKLNLLPRREGENAGKDHKYDDYHGEENRF